MVIPRPSFHSSKVTIVSNLDHDVDIICDVLEQGRCKEKICGLFDSIRCFLSTWTLKYISRSSKGTKRLVERILNNSDAV